MSSSARHLPALDGLRAVAVGLVVGYHCGIPWLTGGYVGVDVFFVLSGFLITSLLLAEGRRDGRLDLLRFWRRRVRRLAPAVIVMVAVVCAATLVVGAGTGIGLRRAVLGAFTWSSNWVQIGAGLPYADRQEPSVFTHLWSLAVEEQFYLVWPILLVGILVLAAAARRHVGSRVPLARRPDLALVGLLAVGSVIAMALTAPGSGDATRAYEGTDSHSFGLLVGALLAMSGLAQPDGARRAPGWRGVAGVTGLAAVVAAAATMALDSWWTYRGGLLLVSLATAVVVAVVLAPGWLSRVLGMRPLAWIGTRSYGIYLWHWPLLVLLTRVSGDDVAGRAGAVALAVLAAQLSYRFVEMPIRMYGLRGATQLARTSWRSLTRPSLRAGVVTAVALPMVMACGALTAHPAQTDVNGYLQAGEAALARAHDAVHDQPPPSVRPPTQVSPTTNPTTTPGGRGPSVGHLKSGGRRPGHLGQRGHHAGRKAGPHGVRRHPRHHGTGTTVSRTTGIACSGVHDGSLVSAFGDSVMVASAPALLAAMPHIDITATVGAQFADIDAAIRAALRHGRLRPVVVIGAGTNGPFPLSDLQMLVHGLGPSRRVVLVTSHVPTRSWQGQVNAALDTVAADWRRVVVADWNAAISGHPDLLASDEIHPNPQGGDVYASVLDAALAATCTAQTSPTH
ncbi:MAG: acyltransferase family protein [Nocardioidaceae bacterium]